MGSALLERIDPVLRKLESSGIRAGFRVEANQILCTLSFDDGERTIVGCGSTVTQSLVNASRMAGYCLGRFDVLYRQTAELRRQCRLIQNGSA